jgi:hypothetical protein
MMTGGGKMPRITPDPSIRILAKGRLCARVAILVALGTLLLAGRAHAAAPVAEPAGEASSPAAVAEPAAETSPPAEPVVASSPEASSPSPVTEPAGETSSPASGAEPAGEAPSSTPAEPAPEVSSPAEPVVVPAPEVSSPAPVAEPVPEASPPAEPVVEPEPKASPPVEPSKEVKEVKEVPTVEPTKEAAEVPAGKPVLEQGAESPSSSLAAASQSAATGDNPSDSAAAEVSGAVGGSVTTIFPSTPEELPTTSVASSACAAALARTIAAQRAEDFTRELGGLGASSTDTYTAGFDSSSLISAAFVGDLAMGTAARAGAPALGGRSGSPPAVRSPIGPPPGPTPSGTFGGAAGGGSGTALSGVPTFAGHLLLGAPLAMRRLRLSFQPWLTAFFVLIPERPG